MVLRFLQTPYIVSCFSMLIIPYDQCFFISVCYDPSWVKMLAPKIPSMSAFFKITPEEKYLSLYTPVIDDYNTYKGLMLKNCMPGVEREEMLACDENKTLLIQGKTHKELMLELVSSSSNKDEIMANIITDIVASFRGVMAVRSWAYYGTPSVPLEVSCLKT